MAPKNTLELRNGPKSDDMKITLRVNGRLDHPQADGGKIVGLNVADDTETIDFRGTITEFSVHRGEGSAVITDPDGNSRPVRFKNLEGWDTRDHAGGGGSSQSDDSIVDDVVDAVTGGGNNESNSGGDATPRGSNAGRPSAEISSANEYRALFDSLAIPLDGRTRVSVANGQYAPGAIQRTILPTQGADSVEIVGNAADPYAVDISRANHNLINLGKDEHVWLEGMTWGRTQFAGTADPYCRDMVFTDRHRPDDSPAASSSIGGKPAAGRFIECELGHRNDPDEHAGVFYGGGSVHLDRDNTIRATGSAYFIVKNTVTLYIDGSNEFASGNKEIVKGSGIKPGDLHDGINIIDAGVRIA